MRVWINGSYPTECVCGGSGYFPIQQEEEVLFTLCPCRSGKAAVKVGEERKWELFYASGLPAPLRRCTFANFDATHSENKKMLEAAQKFVTERLDWFHSEAYERGNQTPTRPWLALFGKRGTGKTHLCAAIARAFIENGRQPIYRYMPDLLDELREAYYSKDAEENYYARLRAIKEAKVLILDDIGVEKPTDWSDEQLDKIIDWRYRHELTTVIATNAGIPKEDEVADKDHESRPAIPLRVADRLRDNAICRRAKNVGRSFRPQNKRGSIDPVGE